MLFGSKTQEQMLFCSHVDVILVFPALVDATATDGCGTQQGRGEKKILDLPQTCKSDLSCHFFPNRMATNDNNDESLKVSTSIQEETQKSTFFQLVYLLLLFQTNCILLIVKQHKQSDLLSHGNSSSFITQRGKRAFHIKFFIFFVSVLQHN